MHFTVHIRFRPEGYMETMPDLDDDQTLLRAFALSGCEESFEILVERYSGLIFNVALRVTNSRTISEEVTQTIFATVARKAGILSKDARVLSGWLHRATVLESAKARRRENRHHRKKSALMNARNESSESGQFNDTLPHLDFALNKLPESERKLVLWHYAEGLSFPVIAKRLGKTTTAVQKQGQRALAKLQKILIAKGVTLSVTALAGLLTTEFAKAAPVPLITMLTPAILAQSPGVSLATTSLVMTTKTKLILPAAALLICGVPLANQGREIAAIHEKNLQMTTTLKQLARVKKVDSESAQSQSPSSRSAGEFSDKITVKDLPMIGEFFHQSSSMAKSARLRDRIRKNSGGELISLINSLDDLDLPIEWKRAAYLELLRGVYYKDPKGALHSAFESPLMQPLRQQGLLVEAFKEWSRENPSEALAWLDRRSSSDGFLSKYLKPPEWMDWMVSEFERAAFSVHIANGPEAAIQRLAGMDEATRSDLFRRDPNNRLKISRENEAGLIRGLREQLPEEQFAKAVSFQAIDLLRSKDHREVVRFLDEHFVDEQERQTLVKHTLGRLLNEGRNLLRPPEEDLHPEVAALITKFFPEVEDQQSFLIEILDEENRAQ